MLIGIAILILVITTVIKKKRENSLLIRVIIEFITDIPETNTAVNIKVANTTF